MTDEKINELRDDILLKLESHDKINIYLEDKGIEHFTMYSVLQGIIFPLQNANRFNRVAMVTNRNWIHMISSLNSRLISATIKNYTTEDRVQAMQWVTTGELSQSQMVNSSLLQKVKDSDYIFANDTLGYIIDGAMDKTAIVELRGHILEKLEYHDKINLYIEDRSIHNFSFSAVVVGALFPLEYASRFNKIALLTDRKWIHKIAAIDNLFIKASIKYYPKDRRSIAMDWISEK